MTSATSRSRPRSGLARAGRLVETAHGTIETPVFMPVGTKGTVKALDPRELVELGAQIVLGNTYHLHFRPGEEVMRELGGLHRFMAWDGPILTDSGGFQVFSLRDTLLEARRGRRDVPLGLRRQPGPLDAGARDGRCRRALGSDIAMAFDECPPAQAERSAVEAAVERTARWAERCVAAPARARASCASGSSRAASTSTCAGARATQLARRCRSTASRSAASRSARSASSRSRSTGETAALLPDGAPALLHGHRRPRGRSCA